jgi:hypothetical protein
LSLLQLQNIISAAVGVLGMFANFDELKSKIDYIKFLEDLIPGLKLEKYLKSERGLENELNNITNQQQQSQGGASDIQF